MKRRNFLRGLLTIAGTAVVAPAVLADPDQANWLQGKGRIWQVKTKISKPYKYEPPGVYIRTVFDEPNKNGDIFRKGDLVELKGTADHDGIYVTPGDTISHEDLAKLNRTMPLYEITGPLPQDLDLICEKTLSPEDLAEISQLLDQPWHERRAAATGFEQQVYDAVDLLAQF